MVTDIVFSPQTCPWSLRSHQRWEVSPNERLAGRFGSAPINLLRSKPSVAYVTDFNAQTEGLLAP
jgi:hypothetical protein